MIEGLDHLRELMKPGTEDTRNYIDEISENGDGILLIEFENGYQCEIICKNNNLTIVHFK